MSEVKAQTVGYYEGVLDLYYALMKKEDTAASAAEYDTPKVLAKNIETTITPRYREGVLHASNVAVRRKKQIAGYDLSVNVDQVLAAVRVELLGRAVDKNGVEILKDTQEAPYVAVGFVQTKDNGEKEMWWLYKGKFSESEKKAKTRGDSIEYQTPTLTAQFDARYDGSIAAIVDSDGPNVTADVVEKWLTIVYQESAESAEATTAE
ncbi:MAG: hypothetical protein IKK75_13975 [Clostridia bacterium]|nr:hypothetical protein [Clostridia bacterium]